jgi:type IV pilus assembly protein PilB
MDAVLKKNLVSERDYMICVSEEFNLPIVEPGQFVIDQTLLNTVPSRLVERYHLLPISRFENTLTVVASNPFDLMAVDDIKAVTGLKVRQVVALPSKLDAAIRKCYPDLVKTSAELEGIMNEVDVNQKVTSKTSEAIDLAHDSKDIPVVHVTNLLILEGIRRRASDIFIEPWEYQLRARCRVDGLLEEIKTLPHSMASSVVSRIKVMSHLNIAERRMPQDGRFKARVQGRDVDFRVSVIPTHFGEKVCIRILDRKQQKSTTLEGLGFGKKEVEKIGNCAKKPNGMLLITGPTGSGKTTTLYAILSYLHSIEKNITTAEDPVEYQVPGINQVSIREQIGLTFAAVLRSALRQDPNIIMVGEIRDLETMDIAIKAALTGHLVLSTLHTNDAASSIVRMTNMGIEPFLIASSVLMISAQRLVRRLCSNCKEPYKPNSETLKLIGRQASDRPVLHRPQGCKHCRKTGFQGRRVITEILVIDPDIKELIMKKATGEEVKRLAHSKGMVTLRESGVEHVLQGETTVEEVLRVTAMDTGEEI